MADKTRTGWTTVAFGDIAESVSDRVDDPKAAGVDRYVGLEHLDADSLTTRRWGSTEDVSSTKLRFDPGDIIFGKRRVYQRKLAVADFHGICSAHALVLRAKPEAVLPEFLPYFMQSDYFMEAALKISVGSLSPTINWKTLAQYEFDLPPIDEQRRIIATQSGWLSLEQRLQDCLLALTGCRTSLLDGLFDPIVAQQVQGGRRAVSDSDWVQLGEIAPLQPGHAFSSDEYSATGDRLLRCSNVAVDGTSWKPDETKFWPTERRSEFSKFVLNVNDIVIAMDRPFVSSGFKTARLTENDLPSLLLQRVGRFQMSGDKYRDLVWAFAHSRSFQSQLIAQQEGTDLPHISKAQIDSTLMPRDALTDEQPVAAFEKLCQQGDSIKQRVHLCRKARRTSLAEMLQ